LIGVGGRCNCSTREGWEAMYLSPNEGGKRDTSDPVKEEQGNNKK